MKRLDFDALAAWASKFEKLAQTVETNTDLVDTIKKSIGDRVFQLASQFLGTRAVSSIPISIVYNKPKAAFQVDATGSDAAQVNTELKAALDRQFAPAVSRAIVSKDPKTQAFSFGLMTVE